MRIRNALLVYPGFPGSFWSFQHALKFIDRKAAMPPLPLMTVAAMLPREWKIRLIDENIEPLTDADLAWADIAFFSAMMVQKESFFTLVSRAKRAGLCVVIGGPYPTSYKPEIEERVPGMVDHFFLGECEETLPGFLEDLESGRARRIYEGPQSGTRIMTDVTRSPTPRFDLVNMQSYATMLVQWSRGCPFDCEFCDITKLFGRIPRLKSASQILAELDALYCLGWRGRVFFVDDDFIGNKKAVVPLLEAIAGWQQKRGHPFQFVTEASIDLAAYATILRLMRRAGFVGVFVGIESPNDAALTITVKGQNRKRGMSAHEHLLKSVRIIQQHGIEVSGGFIVGLDGDTEFDSHVRFIEEAGIPMAMVGLLGAIRGTNLWDRLVREGRILKDGTHSGDNTAFVLNFRTQLPREAVFEHYRAVISTLYEPTLRRYFRRCLTLIRNLGPLEVGGYGSFDTWTNLKAFIRSVMWQGFSRQGPAYFLFLARALLYRPRLFPLAVMLAANGYHFEKVTREAIAAYESTL